MPPPVLPAGNGRSQAAGSGVTATTAGAPVAGVGRVSCTAGAASAAQAASISAGVASGRFGDSQACGDKPPLATSQFSPLPALSRLLQCLPTLLR